MNQTRRMTIADRVFTAADIARIAKIIENAQPKVDEKNRVQVKYGIAFSDKTEFESDNLDVFQEESLTAHGRPVSITMDYFNFAQNSIISVMLSHGDYAGKASVRGDDPAWVNANFQALQDAIARVKPQTSILRQHPTLLLNLIALGIGSIPTMVAHIVDWLVVEIRGRDFTFTFDVSLPSWLHELRWLVPVLVLADWFIRWLIGLGWGAFAVRRWLLAMWPSIEFDFGPPHLQVEKIRRERVWLVGSLIVVPIVTSILYDLMKAGVLGGK